MDLLENYHVLPEPVQDILMAFDEEADNVYNECKETIKKLEKHGYTADYDLSGTLFDLKKKKFKNFKFDNYEVKTKLRSGNSNYELSINIFQDKKLISGGILKTNSTEKDILEWALNSINKNPEELYL